MKGLFISVIILFLLTTCRSQSEVGPDTVWSLGCVELKPDQGAYRLDGMCCTYLLFEPIDLTSSRVITIPGSYYVFTGAGFARSEVTILIQLSPDRQSLYIEHTLPGQSATQSWLLKPGQAKLACQCGCD